jgi:hypothetical protein
MTRCIFDIHYAGLVTDAIVAGCTTPDAIATIMHTLPEFPYVDTDVILEEAADIAAECNGVTFGNHQAKLQYGLDVFMFEMSEESCDECGAYSNDNRLGWRCNECGCKPGWVEGDEKTHTVSKEERFHAWLKDADNRYKASMEADGIAL